MPANNTDTFSARSHAHNTRNTHTSLSEASGSLPGLHLGVCPNSAVVVPEEFPRGRFGEEVGKEAGRPWAPSLPVPAAELQERLETRPVRRIKHYAGRSYWR